MLNIVPRTLILNYNESITFSAGNDLEPWLVKLENKVFSRECSIK